MTEREVEIYMLPELIREEDFRAGMTIKEFREKYGSVVVKMEGILTFDKREGELKNDDLLLRFASSKPRGHHPHYRYAIFHPVTVEIKEVAK